MEIRRQIPEIQVIIPLFAKKLYLVLYYSGHDHVLASLIMIHDLGVWWQLLVLSFPFALIRDQLMIEFLRTWNVVVVVVVMYASVYAWTTLFLNNTPTSIIFPYFYDPASVMMMLLA